MPAHDIVVIGASAGGIEALQNLLSELPRDFPAAVFTVLHSTPEGASCLPDILARVSPMQVVQARDGEAVRKGNVYVAVRDRHLVLQNGHMRLVRGPRENRSRPAIDVLFRSAAYAYGRRVIGVVLTGYLDDGAAGLVEIKRAGGIAIVQDPQDATVPGMPRSAIAQDQPDHVVPLAKLSALLRELTDGPKGVAPRRAAEELQPVTNILSDLTCPECGGPIYEDAAGKMLQFHCEVGHRYSPESMADAQDESVEAAMWAALRALDERARLSDRLATHAKRTHRPHAHKRFTERAAESHAHAAVLRRLLADSGAEQLQEAAERANEKQAG